MDEAMEKKPRLSTGVGEMFRVFDEIALNNENTGNLKIQRSSILKAQRISDIEIYDNEDCQASGGRKSIKKRVSFAEKFQVMELHTGNIYDIIGKKDESTPISQSSQSEEAESSGFDKSMVLKITDDQSLELSGDCLVTETEGQKHEDCGGDQSNFIKSEFVLPEPYKTQLHTSFQYSPHISNEPCQGVMLSNEIYGTDNAPKNSAFIDEKSHEFTAELPCLTVTPSTPNSIIHNFHSVHSNSFHQPQNSPVENYNNLNEETMQSQGLEKINGKSKIYSLETSGCCDPLNKENYFPGKMPDYIRKREVFFPKTTEGYLFSKSLPEKNAKVFNSRVTNSNERNKLNKPTSDSDELFAANKENIYIGAGVNLISARKCEVGSTKIQHFPCTVSEQMSGLNKTNYADVPLDLTMCATELSTLPTKSLNEVQHSRHQIQPQSFKSHSEDVEGCGFYSKKCFADFSETKRSCEDMEITCANLDEDVFIPKDQNAACNTANESTREELHNSGNHFDQSNYSVLNLHLVADKHASKVLRENEKFDFMHGDQAFTSIHDKFKCPNNSFSSILSDKSQSFPIFTQEFANVSGKCMLLEKSEELRNEISGANAMDSIMSDQLINSNTYNEINSKTKVDSHDSKFAKNAFNPDASSSFDPQNKSPEQVNKTLYFDQNLDLTCAGNQEEYFLSKYNISVSDEFGKNTEYSCKMLEETSMTKAITAADACDESSEPGESVADSHFVLKNSKEKACSMQISRVQSVTKEQYNELPLLFENSSDKYIDLPTDSTSVTLKAKCHADILKRCYSSEVHSTNNEQILNVIGKTLLPGGEDIKGNVQSLNVSVNAPVAKKKKMSIGVSITECNDSLSYSALRESAFLQTKAKGACKSYSSLPENRAENIFQKRRHSDLDFVVTHNSLSESFDFQSKSRQRLYEDLRKDYQNVLRCFFGNMPSETLSMKNINRNVNIKPTSKSLHQFQKMKSPFKSNITYALKKLKNYFYNPSESNDDILNFTELFFTLKKNPVIKPSFSCTKFKASCSVKKSLRECDWKILESFNSQQMHLEADNSMKDFLSRKLNYETFKVIETSETPYNKSIRTSLVEQFELEHKDPNTSAIDCLQTISDSVLHDSFESQAASLIQTNSGLTKSTFQSNGKLSIGVFDPLPLQHSRQLHESMEDKNVFSFDNKVLSSMKVSYQNNVFNVDEQKHLNSVKNPKSDIRFSENSVLSVHKAVEETLSTSLSCNLNLIHQSLQDCAHNTTKISTPCLPLNTTPRLEKASEVHQYHAPFHNNKIPTIDIIHQSPMQNSRLLQENTKDGNRNYCSENESLSSQNNSKFGGQSKGIEYQSSEAQISDISNSDVHETGKLLFTTGSNNKYLVPPSFQISTNNFHKTSTSHIPIDSSSGKTLEKHQYDNLNHNDSKLSLSTSPKCSNTNENLLVNQSNVHCEDDIEKFIKECAENLSRENFIMGETNAAASENYQSTNEETSRKKECSDNDSENRHFLRLYFKKESEKINQEWKLSSINENEIVFEIMFEKIHIHVPRKPLECLTGSGSDITFTCNTSGSFVDPSIAELGYTLFMSRVTDTFIQLPLCPKDVVEKLQGYLKITDIGELFMRDIDLISIVHDFKVSKSNDILRFSVDVLNGKQRMQFSMMFPVNMKTYPNEKIIPDLEFIFNFNSIKKEDILCCVENVEPGEDYLFRMVEAARHF